MKTTDSLRQSPEYFSEAPCTGGPGGQTDRLAPGARPDSNIKFCTSCGHSVSLEIPAGDGRERIVCNSCGLIQYINPRVIVGCLPHYRGRVLLCKRGIEPRIGYWSLPAGFMENGETMPLGAARETWEEAEALVSNLELYRVFDAPLMAQVYMFYRCDLDNGKFGIGAESLDSALYAEDDIPWKKIAFPAINETLKMFFEDQREGKFPIRISTIQCRQHDD